MEFIKKFNTVTQVGKKADIAAQLQDVILERIFQLDRFEILFQFGPGFPGEPA